MTRATRSSPALRFCPVPQVDATEGVLVAVDDARVGVPLELTVTAHPLM